MAYTTIPAVFFAWIFSEIISRCHSTVLLLNLQVISNFLIGIFLADKPDDRNFFF